MNGGRRRRLSELCPTITFLLYFLILLEFTKAQFIVPSRIGVIPNRQSIMQRGPPISPPMVSQRRVVFPQSRPILRPQPLPPLNFGRARLPQHNGPLNLRAPPIRRPPPTPMTTTPMTTRPPPPPPMPTPIQRHSSRRRKPTNRRRPTTDRVSTKSPASTVTTSRLAAQTSQASPSRPSHRPPSQQVGAIEAEILKAVIDSSSSTTPIPPSTLRARTHRLRVSSRRPAPLSHRQRVNSIEEAVLRAVIDSTITSDIQQSELLTTTTIIPTSMSLESPKLPATTTTTKLAETETTPALDLFPAFATRSPSTRRHRRPFRPTSPSSSSSIPSTTVTPQPLNSTTIGSVSSTTILSNTTNESEEHQLHEIEKNIIATLNGDPQLIPPHPLPTTAGPLIVSAGPPGSLPPSDDIVNELNDANNFMEVAERLKLIKRLLH